MNAKELREFLQSVPDDAVVTVNGDVVCAATIVNGRIRDGVYGTRFVTVNKGKDHAVVFLRHAEFSDGHLGLVAI